MAEPQNDSTLRWIFRQLMGEGIDKVVNPSTPSAPVTPTIGPTKKKFNIEDPTAIPREWIHKKTEDYLGTPQSWLPTDALSLLSQPAGPEGFDKAVQIGLIPRDFARRFASEASTMIRQHPGNAFSPNTMDAVADMIERHPEITGQISGFGAVLDPHIQGRYKRIAVSPAQRPQFDEAMRKLLRRDPTTIDPGLNQWIQTHPNVRDEDLARIVLQQQQNLFEFNPVALEMHPEGRKAPYKTARHEFQHLLDDLQGKLNDSPPMDQSYWIHPEEVRARAAENNYGRDMGPRTTHGRPFAIREQQPSGRLVTYPDLLSRELDMGLREVESGLHNTYLPMPATFEDSLQSAVERLFGPSSRFKRPASSPVTPNYWESYFK